MGGLLLLPSLRKCFLRLHINAFYAIRLEAYSCDTDMIMHIKTGKTKLRMTYVIMRIHRQAIVCQKKCLAECPSIKINSRG
jgi:hypothetical protein